MGILILFLKIIILIVASLFFVKGVSWLVKKFQKEDEQNSIEDKRELEDKKE